MHTFVIVALLAAPAAPLFVQASAVNLRDRPSPKALIAGKASIGTSCTTVAAAVDGWVQVRCGELTGFTKAELLSATAPDLKVLLTEAGDPARKLDDRWQSAVRAIALAPTSPEALTAWKSVLLATLFHRKDSDERLPWTCTVSSKVNCARGDGKQLVIASTPSTAPDKHFDLISFQPGNGCLALSAALAHYEPTAGLVTGSAEEFALSLPPEAYEALMGQKQPEGASCEQGPINNKLLKSLPKRWFVAFFEKGAFNTAMMCGHHPSMRFVGRDEWDYDLQFDMVQDSASYTVRQVQYDAEVKTYRIELDKGVTFDFAYPIAEDADVARITVKTGNLPFGGTMANAAKANKFSSTNGCDH